MSHARTWMVGVSPFALSPTYRSQEVSLSRRPWVALTEPTFVQLPKSVEYCQVPLPVLPVTTMPLGAPVSTSFQPRALITPKTPNPAVGPSSGYRPPIPTVAPSVIVGASFTAVTVIDAVSVAVLKAVLPPVVLTSTVLPAEPVLWSHARKARVPSAPFIASGRKRTRSAARSSRAEVSATAPTVAQVVPLSSEYCQVPLPVVTVAPVTAIPSSAPASTSVMRSPPPLAMISTTVLPVLVVWSSVIVVSVIEPAVSSTGASFCARTVTDCVTAALVAPSPSLTTNRTVRVAVFGLSVSVWKVRLRTRACTASGVAALVRVMTSGVVPVPPLPVPISTPP